MDFSLSVYVSCVRSQSKVPKCRLHLEENQPFMPVSILSRQSSLISRASNSVVTMPSQADMIATIKAISEQVMESLKILLLMLVNLAEIHATPQQVPEAKSHQLNDLLSEVQQQRYRIEEISAILRSQNGPQHRNQVTAEIDSEGEWDSVSNPPPSVRTQATRAPARSATSRSTRNAEVESRVSQISQAMAVVPPIQNPPSTAQNLQVAVAATPNLETWGQKYISWGKKWTGVRYQEVYEKDAGYVQWISDRVNTLTPVMRDFHLYCVTRQRLEMTGM